MKYCRKCGKRQADDARACDNCGTPFSQFDESLKTTDMGEDNSPLESRQDSSEEVLTVESYFENAANDEDKRKRASSLVIALLDKFLTKLNVKTDDCSELDRSLQVETLGTLVAGEMARASIDLDIEALQKEDFEAAPKEPQYEPAVRVFPDRKPGFPYWIIVVAFNLVMGMLYVATEDTPVGWLFLLLFVVGDVALFFATPAYKKAWANSRSARSEREVLSKEYDKKDAVAWEQYCKDKEVYEENIKEYESRKIAWEEEQEVKVQEKIEIRERIATLLDEIYDKSRIVPAQYHNPIALNYLYRTMNSSNFTFHEALDDYRKYCRLEQEKEHNRQMKQEAVAQRMATEMKTELERQRYREQQEANAIAQKQLDATEKVARELERENKRAEDRERRMRRSY